MIKNGKKKKQDKRSVLTISMRRDVRNGECRSFILFFFTILYHLLDCKMVSKRFRIIYGIAENPRPTGKCVKYTLAAWGLNPTAMELKTQIERLVPLLSDLCCELMYVRSIYWSASLPKRDHATNSLLPEAKSERRHVLRGDSCLRIILVVCEQVKSGS